MYRLSSNICCEWVWKNPPDTQGTLKFWTGLPSPELFSWNPYELLAKTKRLPGPFDGVCCVAMFFQRGCTKLTWSTQKIKRTDTSYFWSEYVSTGCCKLRYLRIFSRWLYRWLGNNSYVHRGFGTSITWNRGMFPKHLVEILVGSFLSVWKKSPCFVIYVKNW